MLWKNKFFITIILTSVLFVSTTQATILLGEGSEGVKILPTEEETYVQSDIKITETGGQGNVPSIYGADSETSRFILCSSGLRDKYKDLCNNTSVEFKYNELAVIPNPTTKVTTPDDNTPEEEDPTPIPKKKIEETQLVPVGFNLNLSLLISLFIVIIRLRFKRIFTN